MALTRKAARSPKEPKLRKYVCPFCGADYAVHSRPGSGRAYHTAICSVCGDVMAAWHGRGRFYRRSRALPDPHRRAAAIVSIAAEAVKPVGSRRGAQQRLARRKFSRGSPGRGS